jgi:glutamate decarboxylase
VVRESMSLDLMDRLIADICSVTQSIMETDEIDLAHWQPFSRSIEKTYGSFGVDAKNMSQAKNPMKNGVHRSVC